MSITRKKKTSVKYTSILVYVQKYNTRNTNQNQGTQGNAFQPYNSGKPVAVTIRDSNYPICIVLGKFNGKYEKLLSKHTI